MSICPSCNAVNRDDYQFCQFCGSKIFAEVVNQSAIDIEIDTSLDFESDITKPLDWGLELQNEELSNEPVDNAIAFTIPIIISPELPQVEITDESFAKPLDNRFILSSGSQLQNIAYVGKTDVGRQRDRNEDDFVAIFQTRNIHGKSQVSDRCDRGLFVLCDGMGGHKGGAEASEIAINSITRQFLPFWIDTLPGEKKINEIIGNANQEIFSRNENEKRQLLDRMGTTLVMLALHDLDLVIAHVGDSRIYKITNIQNIPTDNSEITLGANSPKLEQITRDHEVLNQLIDLGVDLESASARPDAHQLTQALGPNPSDRLEPAIKFFTLTEPTLFLLCSDGLCDNDAIEENWQTHLLPILNQEITLETGLDNLIELGNNVNGHDNITVILVMCDVSN